MKSVGEILQAEREKQRLAIKDVENAISIRAHYLNAIEEGNYEIVPGEVFLKGFIRNYADFLGLNGPEMVDAYRRQGRSSKNIVSITAELSNLMEMDNKISSEPKKPQKLIGNTLLPPLKQAAVKLPLNLIAISAVIVMFIGGLTWYMYSGEAAEPQKQPEVQAVNNVSANNTGTTGSSSTTVQAKSVEVGAVFVEDCWTVVLVDGKNVYEGIPQIGETMSWEAQQTITLKLGNASGVNITYNGKPLGKIGKPGEVLEKTFTPTANKNNH